MHDIWILIFTAGSGEGLPACQPGSVFQAIHPGGSKNPKGKRTAERLWVRVGFRGLSLRVREPGAGLGVEGSFLSGQIFPKYKYDHISPLLKNTPGPSTVYRKMATFPAAVQALHQVTHPQILSPLPSQGLPSLCGGEGCTTARQKDGRWVLGGAGPYWSLWVLQGKLS